MSAAERKKVEALQGQIRGHLKNGHTLAAKKILESEDVKKRFDPSNSTAPRPRWPTAISSKAKTSRPMPGPAAPPAARATTFRRAMGRRPGGLAAGQARQVGGPFPGRRPVSQQFELDDFGRRLLAARAHLVNRKPAEVNRLLGKAAAYPRTFYGLLARRILGMPTAFRWALPPLEEAAIEAVAATPDGQRALALIEVGRKTGRNRICACWYRATGATSPAASWRWPAGPACRPWPFA